VLSSSSPEYRVLPMPLLHCICENDADVAKFRSLLQHVPCRVLCYERRGGMSQNPVEVDGAGRLISKTMQASSPPPSCNARRPAHFLRLQQDQLCTHEHCFQFHTLVAVRCGWRICQDSDAISIAATASAHVRHYTHPSRLYETTFSSIASIGKVSSLDIRLLYRYIVLLRFTTFSTKAYISNRSHTGQGKPR
jgi:hypothetical protein